MTMTHKYYLQRIQVSVTEENIINGCYTRLLKNTTKLMEEFYKKSYDQDL